MVRVNKNLTISKIKVIFYPSKLEAAAYSKVDNVYNPFVRPDPIHICKIHEVTITQITDWSNVIIFTYMFSFDSTKNL